jgi:hypothetical protein
MRLFVAGLAGPRSPPALSNWRWLQRSTRIKRMCGAACCCCGFAGACLIRQPPTQVIKMPFAHQDLSVLWADRSACLVGARAESGLSARRPVVSVSSLERLSAQSLELAKLSTQAVRTRCVGCSGELFGEQCVNAWHKRSLIAHSQANQHAVSAAWHVASHELVLTAHASDCYCTRMLRTSMLFHCLASRSGEQCERPAQACIRSRTAAGMLCREIAGPRASKGRRSNNATSRRSGWLPGESLWAELR